MQSKLGDLRARDVRYALLSTKQIFAAEIAKRSWMNEESIGYATFEKIFNGKHNVDRCIAKLKTFQIIVTHPQNLRNYVYIPVEDFKQISQQTTLLEMLPNE